MYYLTRLARTIKYLPKLFEDGSLTKKASLNAVASALEYVANILVSFIVTPFVVTGLGDFYYGVWKILSGFIGYISPATGRPTQALKFTLAKEQYSTDIELKRKYVGSTLGVLALFSPLMAVLGGLLTWFIPYWIKSPPQYIWAVRITCAVLVFNLIADNLVSVPRSVLGGENKGYKRMGLSTFLIFVGGGLTWLALYLKTGIIGVAVATLVETFITGLFFLQVVRVYSPWFGVSWPSRDALRSFTGLSWWFMGWNLVMNLINSSDVVVLGLLNSVESVTNYTLSKYAPETVISIVAMMVFGILPGLGGILGLGDLKKAAKVRGEIMSFTWLLATVLGTGMLLWNRTFLSLWVGESHFVGTLPNLLIVLVVMQYVFIRVDASVIDLTLRLNRKVIIGAISVSISILIASGLVYFLRMGIIGVSIGIMSGRLILSIAYPWIIGQHLQIKFPSQLKAILRPFLATIFLFIAATTLDLLIPTRSWHSLGGWIAFLGAALLTACMTAIFAFVSGLTRHQQKTIINRVKAILSAQKKSKD